MSDLSQGVFKEGGKNEKKKKKAAFQYFLTPSAPYSKSLSVQGSHDNSSEVTRALSALGSHRKISMKWLLHVQWLFCINFLCEYFYSALKIFTPLPFGGMNQQLKETRYSISSTASSFMMFLNGMYYIESHMKNFKQVIFTSILNGSIYKNF